MVSEGRALKSIAAQVGRSRNLLLKRLRELGLYKAAQQCPWTTDDIDLLARMRFDRRAYVEIAEALGRTMSATAFKAWRLGLLERNRQGSLDLTSRLHKRVPSAENEHFVPISRPSSTYPPHKNQRPAAVRLVSWWYKSRDLARMRSHRISQVAEKLLQFHDLSGDPDRIRTCDPQIRNLVLYPAELRDQLSSDIPASGPFANRFGRRTGYLRRRSTLRREPSR
jgi:hypothetical protein